MASLTRSRCKRPLVEGPLSFSASSAPGTEQPFLKFALSIAVYDEEKGRWTTHRLNLDRAEAEKTHATLTEWLARG